MSRPAPPARTPAQASHRILVVRRDNIGDLLCTTPLLHALRRRHPGAYLAVLASSYNADVLAGNDDVDEVFVFPKRQQRSHGLLPVLSQRWRLLRRLRAIGFDDVLLANGGLRYARRFGGGRIVGFRERDNPAHRQPDELVPLPEADRTHEVRKMAALGRVLDVDEADALGPLRLWVDPEQVAACRERLLADGWRSGVPTVGVHISTRRDVQRWPVERFAAFVQRLHATAAGPVQFMLLWSPGREDDPMHPGDDGRAADLRARCAGLPLFPVPTARLPELFAAVSLADRFVCSDGGAMHVAAALGKPILCFFGPSSLAAQWHPWGTRYELIQLPGQRVDAIDVETALAAYHRLEASLAAMAAA
jgi:ADP-heptose:LPS heptosyltransferase